jgi:hypothetical protein
MQRKKLINKPLFMRQIKDRSYIRAHTFDRSNYSPGFQVDFFQSSLFDTILIFQKGIKLLVQRQQQGRCPPNSISVLDKANRFFSLPAHPGRQYSPPSLPFKKYRKLITGDKTVGP